MTLAEFFKNVLFGLAFGIGFALAWAVIQLLIWLLTHAQVPTPMGK